MLKKISYLVALLSIFGCVDNTSLQAEKNTIIEEYEEKRKSLTPIEYYNSKLKVQTWHFDYDLCTQYNTKIISINNKYAEGKLFGLEATEKALTCNSTKKLIDTLLGGSKFYKCRADYEKRSKNYSEHKKLTNALKVAGNVHSDTTTDWCKM